MTRHFGIDLIVVHRRHLQQRSSNRSHDTHNTKADLDVARRALKLSRLSARWCSTTGGDDWSGRAVAGVRGGWVRGGGVCGVGGGDDGGDGADLRDLDGARVSLGAGAHGVDVLSSCGWLLREREEGKEGEDESLDLHFDGCFEVYLRELCGCVRRVWSAFESRVSARCVCLL